MFKIIIEEVYSPIVNAVDKLEQIEATLKGATPEQKKRWTNELIDLLDALNDTFTNAERVKLLTSRIIDDVS